MAIVFWSSQQFGRRPFIRDIETGNYRNYDNDALPHETFGFQVSESENNAPPFLDVTEEMSQPYVQSCKKKYAEANVKTGIRYLNSLGGISQHRNHKNLSNAIEHVLRMREIKRINSFGLPDDFSKESLIEILVRMGNHELADVIHAVDQCRCEGFFPEPEECAEKIFTMKEELRNEVEERNTEIIHNSEVFAQSQSETIQERAECNLMIRDLKAKLQEKECTIQEKERTIQEKERIIQEKERISKELKIKLKYYEDEQ
ncbi:uncharacterized protein LOC125660688 isoform X2 [Ostrea edulis]|uniref:uncharacterized protein LOC125660688 isoform X2 n=1 Tax=Ostrea edulis TaxID=37623 RepID=UPI0024AF9EDB|nr:uncharacterized protein LOC125660688 isoform X2 [Ostrea edulis]